LAATLAQPSQIRMCDGKCDGKSSAAARAHEVFGENDRWSWLTHANFLNTAGRRHYRRLDLLPFGVLFWQTGLVGINLEMARLPKLTLLFGSRPTLRLP
jgi:hypothetical protein